MSDADLPPEIVHYDKHYLSGGFGYEERLDDWRLWAELHYVEAFDLAPLRGRWRLRRPRARPKLLDVACGNGFWTSVFSDLGFDAVGIDRSTGGIEMAQSRYTDLTFHQADAEGNLPFEERSFDVVFVRAITHLHHKNLMADNTKRLVANLMRYVAPSGQMLQSYYTKRDGGGTEYHHYHPVSDLVRLFEHAGEVWRVDVVGDFVQVGVRHR